MKFQNIDTCILICIFNGIQFGIRMASSGYRYSTLTHFPLDKIAAILADDTFKCIFLNEKVRFLTKISLKAVPNGTIDDNPALV